jgi:hypothetical protein
VIALAIALAYLGSLAFVAWRIHLDRRHPKVANAEIVALREALDAQATIVRKLAAIADAGALARGTPRKVQGMWADTGGQG